MWFSNIGVLQNVCGLPLPETLSRERVSGRESPII